MHYFELEGGDSPESTPADRTRSALVQFAASTIRRLLDEQPEDQLHAALGIGRISHALAAQQHRADPSLRRSWERPGVQREALEGLNRAIPFPRSQGPRRFPESPSRRVEIGHILAGVALGESRLAVEGATRSLAQAALIALVRTEPLASAFNSIMQRLACNRAMKKALDERGDLALALLGFTAADEALAILRQLVVTTPPPVVFDGKFIMIDTASENALPFVERRQVALNATDDHLLRTLPYCDAPIENARELALRTLGTPAKVRTARTNYSRLHAKLKQLTGSDGPDYLLMGERYARRFRLSLRNGSS